MTAGVSVCVSSEVCSCPEGVEGRTLRLCETKLGAESVAVTVPTGPHSTDAAWGPLPGPPDVLHGQVLPAFGDRARWALSARILCHRVPLSTLRLPALSLWAGAVPPRAQSHSGSPLNRRGNFREGLLAALPVSKPLAPTSQVRGTS